MTGPAPEDRFRVIVIVGTRPEAIKLFPVIHRLHESPLLEPFVINTGQHYDLVKPVFDMAGITPDVDLGVGAQPNSLNELVGKVTTRIETTVEELREKHPNRRIIAALVHGDTTTAMAGALASIQVRLPVVHVEAGLRTGDTLSPFPEELNRQIIARIACFHLAPTVENMGNLVSERIPATRVFVTGNTGIDALKWAATIDEPFADSKVQEIVDSDRDIIVSTVHRRENWGGGLARVAEALRQVAEIHPEISIILPMHPNPKVREEVQPILDASPNVLLTEPLEYANFARLLKRAKIAVTDSGGIQEEAPSLRTPVLVTRDQTERGEGVAAGTLKLVGTDTDRIRDAALELLENDEAFWSMADRSNPYGDGYAAQRIVASLETLAFGESAPTAFGPSFSRIDILRAAGYQDQAPSEYELAKVNKSAEGATRYIGPERRYDGPDRRHR